jgi:serine/threonine protein kinase
MCLYEIIDIPYENLYLDLHAYTYNYAHIYIGGYTSAVDWWSLGIFLFELLTGKTPFNKTSKVYLYMDIYISSFRHKYFYKSMYIHINMYICIFIYIVDRENDH